MALRDLPSFRRSQNIIPTPVFTPQASEDLGNVLSNISKSSAQKVKQLGVERAGAAGAEAGAILGGAAPRAKFTAADKAFDRAWTTAQTGAIQIDVRDSLKKIQAEVSAPGQLNTHSSIEYQNKANGYLEGLIKNVPPQVQQQTLNYFSYYNNQNAGIVNKQVGQLNKNQLTTQFFEYRNKSTRDIQQAAFDAPLNGDAENSKAGALYGQLAQRTHEAVLGGIITPKMGEDMLNSAQRDAQQENYLGQFDAVLRLDDPEATGKWLNQFEKSSKKDLVPQEKRNLVVKMLKLQKEHENLQVTNNINLQQDKLNALSMVEHGATENDILPVIERVNRFETDAAKTRFEGELQAAVLKNNVSDALRVTPPSQVPGLLKQFKLDKEDPFFAQKSKILDGIGQIQDRFRKELLDDPAAYALSTPTVQQSIQERNVSGFDVNATGTFKPQPGDSPVTNDVDQQMLTVQKRMEVPDEKLSLLPKKTLETFGNQIAQLPFSEQISAIEQELDAHDKSNQAIVLRDLNKAGIAPAHSLVLNASYARTPELSREIPLMIQAFSESKEDLKKAITSGQDVQNLKQGIAENNDEYHASLMNYKGPSETAISQLLEDQEQYALFLMARKGVSKEEATRRAALPLNGAYQFEELKGSTYRIPRLTQTTPNMEPVLTDVRAVKTQSQLLIQEVNDDEDVFVPDEYMIGVPERLARINYRKDLQANSTIMTTPDNQAIAVIDAYGNIVRNNTGKIYQSKFSDIQNNSAEIKSKTLEVIRAQTKTELNKRLSDILSQLDQEE